MLSRDPNHQSTSQMILSSTAECTSADNEITAESSTVQQNHHQQTIDNISCPAEQEQPRQHAPPKPPPPPSWSKIVNQLLAVEQFLKSNGQPAAYVQLKTIRNQMNESLLITHHSSVETIVLPDSCGIDKSTETTAAAEEEEGGGGEEEVVEQLQQLRALLELAQQDLEDTQLAMQDKDCALNEQSRQMSELVERLAGQEQQTALQSEQLKAERLLSQQSRQRIMELTLTCSQLKESLRFGEVESEQFRLSMAEQQADRERLEAELKRVQDKAVQLEAEYERKLFNNEVERTALQADRESLQQRLMREEDLKLDALERLATTQIKHEQLMADSQLQRDKLSLVETELSSLQLHCEQYKSEAQSQLTSVSADREAISSQLDELKNRYESLRTASQQEICAIHGAYKEVEAKALAERRDLENQLESLRGQLVELEAAKQDLLRQQQISQCANLTAIMERMQAVERAGETLEIDLRRAVEQREIDSETHNSQLQELKGRLAASMAALEALRGSNERLYHSEITRLESQLAEMNSKYALVSEERERFRLDLSIATTASREMSESLARSLDNGNEQRLSIAQLGKQLEEVKQAMELAIDRAECAEKEAEASRQQLEGLKSQLDQQKLHYELVLERSGTKFDKQLAELRTQCLQSEAMFAQSKQLNDELVDKIAETTSASQLTALTSSIISYIGQIKGNSLDIYHQIAAANQAMDEISQDNSQIDLVFSRVATLSEQLKQRDEKISQLTSEIDNWTQRAGDYDQLQMLVVQLKRERDSLQRKLDRLQLQMETRILTGSSTTATTAAIASGTSGGSSNVLQQSTSGGVKRSLQSVRTPQKSCQEHHYKKSCLDIADENNSAAVAASNNQQQNHSLLTATSSSTMKTSRLGPASRSSSSDPTEQPQCNPNKISHYF